MKNKNIFTLIFVLSILFVPAAVFGAGGGEGGGLEFSDDAFLIDGPVDPNVGGFIGIGGGDGYWVANYETGTWVWRTGGGGGGDGETCVPTIESCSSACAKKTPSSTTETQTCTDGCQTYEKVCASTPPPFCVPPPSCVPTGINTYGACSATCGGGTRTVTDSCGKVSNESCNTQPCGSICVPDCSQTNRVCSGQKFTDANRCGTDNCTGTRSCDYNWKEVAP